MAMVFEEQILVNLIEHAVRSKIADVLQIETKKAVENLTQEIKNEVDRIALSVLDSYEIHRDSRNIIITVKKNIKPEV